MPGCRPEAELIAVTGATGFVGRHLVRQLADAGCRVRILARRDPAAAIWNGLEIDTVIGDLNNEAALKQLLADVDAVIHLAGCVRAPDAASYFRTNFGGTRALGSALLATNPGAHLVLVSSLAAREPAISPYAASKRAAEDWLQAYPGPCSIIRPSAVYGPVDRETLTLFRLARGPLVPLLGPPAARVALVHVSDLAAALVRVATAEAPPAGAGRRAETPATVCDARAEGYTWTELMGAARAALGLPRTGFLQIPLALLRLLAGVTRIIGRADRPDALTGDKLREMQHLNWAVSAAEQFTAHGWLPRYTVEAGFADTVRAYREAGYLS